MLDKHNAEKLDHSYIAGGHVKIQLLWKTISYKTKCVTT